MLTLLDNDDVRITGLNVCGLLGKLRLGILETFVEDIDIACVCETKVHSTNDYVQSFLPSHRLLLKKEGRGEHLSGTHGLAIIVRNRISSNVTLIDNVVSCKHVMWAKVVLENNVEFILGNVYIPHEGSVHYDDEWYDNISSDLITLSELSLPFILVGDFNSRTGTLDDFMEYDETIANECGLDIEFDLTGVHNGKEYLESIGINSKRQNRDKHINNNGRKLIELCQVFNLTILNGRMGSDRGVGDFTCNTAQGNSTVDYVLISAEMLPIVTDFSIDEFDSCLSDVHHPLNLTLIGKDQHADTVEQRSSHLQVNDNSNAGEHCRQTRTKWQKDLTTAYQREVQNLYPNR